MVLGMRSKNRNSPSVQLDYHMQIQVVKPWPPSQSMRSLRAVLIQWEYGDRKSGSTKSVVPTMGSVVGEGKIEFNESFRLPVTLLRDMSVKNADVDTFQKNCLEFNLYEPRRDKTAKGQLLATAMVNLADYGIVKDVISLNIPMNCKRTVRNTTQALLYLKIQPVDKLRTNSLSKEASLGKDGSESVSALMNEEYDDEAEIASFTDDDVASHSSLGVSSSSAFNSVSGQNRNEENGSAAVTNESTWKSNKKNTSDKKLVLENSNMPHIKPSGMPKASSSCSSSIALSSGPPSPQEGYYSTPDSPHTSLTNTLLLGNKNTHDRYNVSTNAIDNSFTAEESCGKIPVSRSAAQNGHQQLDMKNSVCNFASKVSSQHNNQKYLEKLESSDSNDLQFDGNAHRVGSIGRDHLKEDATGDNICFLEEKVRKEQENAEARWQLQEKMHSRADELLDRPEGTDKEAIVSGKSLPSSKVNIGFKENIQKSEHPRPVKSVRSPLDPARTSSLLSSGGKEVNAITNRKYSSVFPRDSRTAVLENKMQQLESQITMLEGELREAAAIEAAVYSVAAEHGCSISKVHAPARRLSRLYLHACKENVKSQMASAARSAVSGLILVAKACGNDVSRLTFWLSNSVVLRAIVSQSIEDHQLPVSSRILVERNTGDYRSKRISSQLNSVRKGNNNLGHGSVGDWDDPHAFTSALENAEAWIFSRIIDSIWWQTLTPYMQSTVRREIDKGLESACKKNLGRMSSSVDQEQGSFSLDLWKRAFKDACEQLCPVRAGGHECSCLPMLARLVMEQCIIRLDVAMFNAILRESVDDIPTDPVSDPISDLKVLPIPAGKSSFGAGAQLKNTIGNWSRWLTDLFGINDDDPSDNESNYTDDDKSRDKCFKPFYLLNALSDLMMLPKDMLLNKSIRKEVCLTFGAPLIKKVLDIFLPDEFCPDPIPNGVMEALDSEDPPEAGEGSIVDFPCTAAPPLYSPPSASTISDIVGDNGNRAQLRRKGSSVLKKSNTSDDELEDLDSPLAFILADDSHPSAMKNNSSWGVKRGGSNPSSVRYELLRNVWLNGK